MVMNPPLSGVFAALCTPVDELGRPDYATLDRVIEFLVEREIRGIVAGGATAEFPHFDVDERLALATRVIHRMNGKGRVLVSVGTSAIHSTLRLARGAAEAGADALLLSMPYFFRYSQDDLVSYCETVCGSVSAPWLLYNLPSFTNPLEAPTALRILSTIPNVIGLKDSSGRTMDLETLAAGRKEKTYSLFVGDDSLLLGALQAGWDGVVSGIACFAPEFIHAVYRSYRERDEPGALRGQATLDELIHRVIADLPIPWGVRTGLAARGIATGPMHVPPSLARLKQMEEAVRWLTEWAAARGLQLNGVWKGIAA